MDPVEIQRLVVAVLPDRAQTPVRALSSGLDNVAYEVGDLIVRVARRPDPAALAREAALLSLVARVSPLPIPRPVIVAAEQGLLAYPTLPGRPLLDVPTSQRPALAVASALGELLAPLHAVPGAQLAGLVEADDARPSAWLAEAAQHYATAHAAVPAAYRPAIESFLDAPPAPEPPALVLSHNDLGAEHVLIDDLGTVTGVIDW